ncbi:hypothetical protein I302_108178 [Kwoniella bestiolae CBS 10118]|uniref:Uncharacterized protein n=1 Tax=Kwoniella bestiolae CBS 10118 TaxID=1296100 RepID=A0AAJ8KF03_9TREE
MNILIDDASPQIRYFKGDSLAVGWITEHTPRSKYPDTFTNRYSESTFHGTFGEGDYMKYRFNGTGITVYGAKRPNHGVYGVKIDNNPEERYDGKGKNEFQAVLYQKMGLDEGVEHSITMTNYPSATQNATEDLWFDIDHIIITHNIPSTMYTTYIDDSSPSVSYDPSWVSYGYGTGGYYNLTDHMSPTAGSSMQLKFNGSSIQLYGGVNNAHGDFTISLDGGEQEVYNANNWQLVYQVPMYTASGLTEGEHTITMTNQGASPQNVVGFDFAIVNSSIKPPETDAGNPSSTSDTSQTSSTSSPGAGASTSGQSTPSLNIGALAGGISAGVVGLALIIVLAIWFFKRRRKDKDETHYYSEGYRPGEPSTGRLDLVSDSDVRSPSTQHTQRNPDWVSSNGSNSINALSLRDRKGGYIPQPNSYSTSSGSPVSPGADMRELNQYHHPFLQNMHSQLQAQQPTHGHGISPNSASISLSNSSSHQSSANATDPTFQYFTRNHSRNNTSSSSPLTSSPLPTGTGSPSNQYHSPVSAESASHQYHSPNSSRTLPRTFGESPVSVSHENGLHRNNTTGTTSAHSHQTSHSARIRDAYNNPLPYTAAHAGPTPPYSQSALGTDVSPVDRMDDGEVDEGGQGGKGKERQRDGFAWG